MESYNTVSNYNTLFFRNLTHLFDFGGILQGPGCVLNYATTFFTISTFFSSDFNIQRNIPNKNDGRCQRSKKQNKVLIQLGLKLVYFWIRTMWFTLNQSHMLNKATEEICGNPNEAVVFLCFWHAKSLFRKK